METPSFAVSNSSLIASLKVGWGRITPAISPTVKPPAMAEVNSEIMSVARSHIRCAPRIFPVSLSEIKLHKAPLAAHNDRFSVGMHHHLVGLDLIAGFGRFLFGQSDRSDLGRSINAGRNQR